MSLGVTDEAFVGFRITREKPVLLLWLGLVYVVSMLLTFGLGYNAIKSLLAMMQLVQNGSEPSQEEFIAAAKNYGQLMLVSWPISLVTMALTATAVVRAVLQPEDSRFGYLRFSKDEMRTFLALFLMGLIWFGLMLVSLLIVGMAATAGMAAGMFAGLIVVLVALVAAFYLAVKLSLVVPITVMEKRIGIAESFRLTKGHFWPLAGLGLLAIVLSIGVSLLVNIISIPFSVISNGGFGPLLGDPITFASAIGMTGSLVLSILLTSAQMLIVYSPFSAAYRKIKAA